MRHPRVARTPAVRTPIVFVVLLLATAIAPFPPVVFAGESGVQGFAFCGTFDPTSSFYVPGDPVYLSDIFRVKSDSPPNFDLAFKNFLKQKYGWNKNVTCSLSYTSDGASKTFDEKIRQAGAKLVRTGWTLGSAGTVGSGAGSSTAGAAAPDPAAGNSNWVCRVSGTDGKDYNSGIFKGSDAGYATFPTAFGQFVQSIYHVKFESAPTCTNYGVLGLQQAQEALKGYASYSTGVMTGWKYATGTGASSAAASSAAPASGSSKRDVYWVCQHDYYQKNYVSDVFALSAGDSDVGKPMASLNQQFTSFLQSKYGLKPHVGSGSCLPLASEAQARETVRHILKSANGQTGVATGWKPGLQANGTAASASPSPESAAAAAVSTGPFAESAPAGASASAPPVTTNITVRLVDGFDSSTDQPGRKYRGVVTHGASAGSVRIPRDTLASVTFVQQSAGTFSAQLVSLKLNGQDVAVSSTAVTTTSTVQQAQEVAEKFGGLLSGLGKHGAATMATTANSTVGNHASIPPGTTLTFSTSVPQPGVSVTSVLPQSAMPAAASNQGPQQQNGELGPDGQVIGGSTSGVMTAYYCYAQTIPPGKHRQTSYTTDPFSSTQPQLWITFWFSQYVHQTHNVPANVANFTIACDSLGKRTPAQQQAVVTANITSWKEHDNDVVRVNWVPTQTPTPGISVTQLNPVTGQMTTGGIGSNRPP